MIDQSYKILIPQTFGKYEYIRKIGGGSFSIVILAKNRNSHNYFACKVVSRTLLVEQNIFDRFEQEVRVLQSFNHPNIIRIEDIVFDDDLIFLVMEYCSIVELFSYIIEHGSLTEFQITRLLRQILSSLVYIHERNIAHRDLKPENILLDENLNIKLIDFGLCHQISIKQFLMTPCGSPYYAPPEIVINNPYDGKKSDMWSLGVVLFSMATGSLPWTENNQTALLDQIVRAEYTIPNTVPLNIRNLILNLMNPIPDNRFSAEEASNLEWLMETNKDFEIKMLQFKRPRSLSFGQEPNPIQIIKPKKQLIVRPRLPSAGVKNYPTTELTPILNLIRKTPKTSKLNKKNNSGSVLPDTFDSF